MSGIDLNDFEGAISYRPGDILFVEGEPSKFIYLIESGEVRIVKEGKNSLIPISVLRKGEFIGELSLFKVDKRSATAIVTEETLIHVIEKKDINSIIGKCPDWVKTITETLSGRLRHSIEMLREHHIIDDLIEQGGAIGRDDQKKFLASIEDYRAKRDITR